MLRALEQPAPSRKGASIGPSQAGYFFLETKLLFLDVANHRSVGRGAGHFPLKAVVQSGVFGLQRVDMG